jgi:hypothetical protein
MTEEETQVTIGSLRQGAFALCDALSGFSDELAQRVPAPGRWSILQCVEHIALTEDFLFASIAAAETAPVPLLNARREAAFLSRGADRTRPVDSPQDVLPRGGFSSVDQAMRHFLASREKTLLYASANAGADLRCLVTSHPLFGAVNVYEVLLLMAVHVQRHIRQIEEIRTDLS